MLVGFTSAGDTLADFGIAFVVSETLTVFAFAAAVVFIVQTNDNSVGVCGFALIWLAIAFCAYAILTELSFLADISAAAAIIEIEHQIDAFRMKRIAFVAIGVACITGKRAFVISIIVFLAVTAMGMDSFIGFAFHAAYAAVHGIVFGNALGSAVDSAELHIGIGAFGLNAFVFIIAESTGLTRGTERDCAFIGIFNQMGTACLIFVRGNALRHFAALGNAPDLVGGTGTKARSAFSAARVTIQAFIILIIRICTCTVAFGSAK